MAQPRRWHVAERLEDRFHEPHPCRTAMLLREQLRRGHDCWRLHPRGDAVWDLQKYLVLHHGAFYIAVFNPDPPPGRLVTVLSPRALSTVNLNKLRAALGKRGRRAVTANADLKRRHRLAWDQLKE